MGRRGGMTFRVDGLRQVQREIRGAEGKELRAELRRVNKSAAEIVADAAEVEAPRGPSGRLARSVKAAASGSSATVKAGTAARVPYAGVIHFGGRGIEPDPFLHRAFAKTSKEAHDQYEEKIHALVAKIGTRRR